MQDRRMRRFAGKVAMVTGGASGIGKATAVMFAAEGAAVAVVDLDDELGKATAQEILSADGRAISIRADVRRAADCQRAVSEVVGAFGALHVLFNNAGLIRFGTAETTTEEDWDLLVDVMLKGTFLMSKYAVPAIRASGGGSIVNSGSNCSFRGSTGMFAYTAPKAAMPVLTMQMAADFLSDKIRVNCVAPGFIRSPLADAVWRFRHDIPESEPIADSVRDEWQTPESIAESVLFLASEEAADIVGVTLPVSLLRLMR
ncbi:MAG: SDR family NAD(P)-dependent oxidoreductase [Chloroflexota bacterium]